MAGWTFRSEDHHVFLRSPDYTHGTACRGETLSRFDFHLVLEREGWKTVEQVLVPCTVLVLISFIAFFIDIKTLMPRIAVGFLTFLTMTNWEASTVETFASQEHPVWFIEFFKVMRLIVAMTLWQETTHTITQHHPHKTTPSWNSTPHTLTKLSTNPTLSTRPHPNSYTNLIPNPEIDPNPTPQTQNLPTPDQNPRSVGRRASRPSSARNSRCSTYARSTFNLSTSPSPMTL